MKKIFSVVVAVLLAVSVFALAGCTDKPITDDESQSVNSGEAGDPVATISVKGYGDILVELYYDKAPNTVRNFISLANKGYYDGLTFHRIIEGFMIQGGCPYGTGTGDPGYSIEGEFADNGFETNDIKHEPGVISMARSNSFDSAGSQFFIVHQEASHLDGQYAAFGKVIEGMDIVDEIAAVKTDSNDKPVKDVVIESVTINTYGVTYDEPVTLR